MRIAHLADIHWRGLARHGEYKRVFETLIEETKTSGIDAFFLGGDIWHTKTQGMTAEFIELFTDILTRMAEVAPVHMILGNHDLNVANMSRQDVLTPIVLALNNPRIKLYKQSGVYQFAPGYNWCVFSICDEKNWEHVKPVPGEYNIACFHGPVRGARMDNDWEVDEGIDADFFADYDLALLGDLHRQQFLSEREYKLNGKKVQRPWIGYPSSTLQQSHGEPASGHGYLIWSIDDTSRVHDVSIHQLPNLNPFITVDWAGSVSKTLSKLKDFPTASRFRVKCDHNISQHDMSSLVFQLSEKGAIETTFKTDDTTLDKQVIDNNTVSTLRADLRNPDVLVKMLREYYADEDVTSEQWSRITELVQGYMHNVQADDNITRNVKWSLKRLEFDNTYAYGEGNVINFQKLKGIIGIFGPNRIGKSSVVGTLLYSLFNSSDRASLKNLSVINTRKDYCKTRALVNVAGVDHIFERQTAKVESKRGPHGVTHLNAWKVNPDGSHQDLNGEQRNDTDKVIRGMLGLVDDFLITNVSAQDEMKKFVKAGAAARKQVLSRFFDLDIFERLHWLVNDDVKETKALLKGLVSRDWDEEIGANLAEITSLEKLGESKTGELKSCEDELETVREKLAALPKDIVSQKQVKEQERELERLQRQYDADSERLAELQEAMSATQSKLKKLDEARAGIDIVELRKRQQTYHELESIMQKMQHDHAQHKTRLTAKERSVLKLLEVPCGDQFPTCKYISDSHQDRHTIDEDKAATAKSLENWAAATKAVEALDIAGVADTIQKYDRSTKAWSDLTELQAKQQDELNRQARKCGDAGVTVVNARQQFETLQKSQKVSVNAEKERLETEKKRLQGVIQGFRDEQLMSAEKRGHLSHNIVVMEQERDKYAELTVKQKLYELIANAFSKRGIPNRVIHSRLPTVNKEISKLLSGITNFTIDLEANDDDLEAYLNYGDSKRLLELGSGMEKVIASLALRVVLHSISSLPKSDMFIIDEGFSDLDENGIETCNRLIKLLKKKFRCVLIISHLDGIKDVVDDFIEVERVEHDARLVWT